MFITPFLYVGADIIRPSVLIIAYERDVGGDAYIAPCFLYSPNRADVGISPYKQNS